MVGLCRRLGGRAVRAMARMGTQPRAALILLRAAVGLEFAWSCGLGSVY